MTIQYFSVLHIPGEDSCKNLFHENDGSVIQQNGKEIWQSKSCTLHNYSPKFVFLIYSNNSNSIYVYFILGIPCNTLR